MTNGDHDPVAPAQQTGDTLGRASDDRRQPGSGRAFEVVLDHIEELVLEGRLHVGDRLPAERDLALQLGVSRPAVREAIRTLEAQGVLASRVGSGATAGTHVISERSQALGRLLRLQVALGQFPIDEVVVTRITLERSSCALAAGRHDEEQLGVLAELVEAMDHTLDRRDFNEVDIAFHVAIAQVAGNTMMSDLTAAVRESLRRPILEAERTLDDWEVFRIRLLDGHRAILDAISRGDACRAADLVEQHIRDSYARLPIGRDLPRLGNN